MEQTHTTLAIQGYLDELAGLRCDDPVEPVVRALLERSAGRLELLCGTLLFRSYPRLTRPPLNLQSEEMLSAVVERLLKALREARPGSVRQFFAIANQHMRWELNDLARHLDEHPPTMPIPDGMAMPPASSGSQISPVARRLFQAIDDLPEDEREVFSLIRIQELTRTEAAEILGVSVKTVQRRMNRAILLLSEAVGDLRTAALPPSMD
ncbi:MAG: sigma-70 family RNA polymerase sigma factor [Phycisphaerales bacterium]|nr:sigma-70 family RNA polymerase sigma factor [Phycisphaerales bacterium]